MAEMMLKKSFENQVLRLIDELLTPCLQKNGKWEGETGCYSATVEKYARQSRDIKFRIFDQYDSLLALRDTRTREASAQKHIDTLFKHVMEGRV